MPPRHGTNSSSNFMGVKLGVYDGNTCLQTFLARFENCAEYFRWDDRDRLFQLRSSLTGAAGQILWNAGKQTTVDRIIVLLQARFGNENQAERFQEKTERRITPGSLSGRLQANVFGVPGRVVGAVRHRRPGRFLESLGRPGPTRSNP